MATKEVSFPSGISVTGNLIVNGLTVGGPGSNTSSAYHMMVFLNGTPDSNDLVYVNLASAQYYLPQYLSGSYAKSDVAPAGSTSLRISKNGSQIGSIDFAAGSNTATFTFGSQVVFSPGDKLDIKNAITGDITISDIAITLVGTRG